MAASDNTAAASAALRRLASEDEAVLMAALSYMGREPFRRAAQWGALLPHCLWMMRAAAARREFEQFFPPGPGGQSGQPGHRPTWGERQQHGRGLCRPGCGGDGFAHRKPCHPGTSVAACFGRPHLVGRLSSVHQPCRHRPGYGRLRDGCGRHYFVLSIYGWTAYFLYYARHRRTA